MFYKIRDDVLFRRYNSFGYITDNSEFGYQLLNDTQLRPGETFVSESGAVMLSELSKTPRQIDDVVKNLMCVFEGVQYEVLKADTIEFFQSFVERGYLSEGESAKKCVDVDRPVSIGSATFTVRDSVIPTESCFGGHIGPNDFLRSIHFDIAGACNECCVHCYIPEKYRKKVIDPELFIRVLEEARMLNVIHVTLSGGEPLLHRDFASFLKRCRELDLSVNVLSNLTLLTDDIIAEMKSNPLLSVQTSLYSMNSCVHDSITGLKGSFNKTVRGIRRILDAGIPVQISCPVMKQNKNTFFDVVEWGKAHNIAVAIEPVIFASYDDTRSNLDSRISLEELDDVLDKEILGGYADGFCATAKEKESLTDEDPVCSVCRYSLCVSAEGDVFPCAGWQANVVGSLNKSTLKEIWERSDKIQQLREIKWNMFSKCINCENRGYCTVCMMVNANENPNADPFTIDDFRCQVAAMIHRKIKDYVGRFSGDSAK